MSNVSKLKKKAADFEQKRQFDRAVQAYIELLDTLANDIDDADIPLYNRVGDLLIRQNSASEALAYYEKAVDLYSERGFLNNAIALCNKILRQSPGRTVIYYKLGKISATKGFKSDAKRNFLEYADRMEKTGKRDEAFRALKEFADLCPDQDDVRLMLAEHLARDNRKDEAIEQLQTLHAKLETEGRSAEARATLDRMKAIDPEVEPKPSGAYKIVKSNELIFLDVDDVPAPRPSSTPSESVPAARAPQPRSSAPDNKAGQAPDATLEGLDLTLVPEDAAGAPTETDLVEGFTPTGEHDHVTPGGVPRLEDFDTGRASEEELDVDFPSLIDVPALGDDPNETVPVHGDSFVDETLSETEFAALELEPLDAPVEERPHDLALPTELPLLRFTDEVATIAEQTEIVQTPNTGVDLDSEIAPPISRSAPAPVDGPDLQMAAEDVVELVEADPLTIEAAAADLEEALSLDEGMEAVPNAEQAYDVEATMYPAAPGASADVEPESEAAGEAAHSLEWEDLAEAAAAHTVHPLQLPSEPTLEEPGDESKGEIDPHFLDQAPGFGASATPPDAGFSPFPLSLDTLTPDENATEHRAPISEIEQALPPVAPPPVQESVEHVTEKGLRERPEPARAVEAKSLVETLREQLDAAPNDARLRRRFAEALLDTGEREQGLRELDAAMRAIENEGDLHTARDIANEILRLVPESVRHHQKCVEYAVRAGDRAQLIEAYLALADALFRVGEHGKAQAVYGRVVELEPNERRALHVLDLLAGRAPGEGALAQRTTAPPSRTAEPEGPEAGDPSFDEPLVEDLDAEVAAAFQSPDESPGSDYDTAGNGLRPGDGFATPAFVPSGDFIDLGAMLRGDQPEKSTRMVVGDAKPTGDEQADFEDMLRRFKQGVAANVDDEDFDSHYDLGVAFKEMGLVDDAIAQFQKALGSETHRSRAYEALGQCFVEKQQHHVAATLLKRAVETTRVDDRVLVGSLYLLGYACEHLQRDREALVYYQRVFAVDVDFRDVATRIRALESQAAS